MTPTIVLAIEPGTAERVARTGGALASDLGARIVLAHVRNDPPLFNSGRERERARNRTTGAAARFSNRPSPRSLMASKPTNGSSWAFP